MLPRAAGQLVSTRLRQFPAVALLGPRQVGKTTLARAIAARYEDALYLDLEDPADRRRLDDPGAFLAAHRDHLVVLDEIHRVPEIFAVLRGQIDRRRRDGRKAGHFLILGSASLELLKQSSESLAGRIAHVELTSLLPQEVDASAEETSWVRGGFPDSFLAEDDDASFAWRRIQGRTASRCCRSARRLRRWPTREDRVICRIVWWAPHVGSACTGSSRSPPRCRSGAVR